jgi:hypothetical protein
MTDDITIGSRTYYKNLGEWRIRATEGSVYDPYVGEYWNLLDEIERLRADLKMAIHVKQFVSFWWDDPSKVGECCAAWDNLPEEVRMWVLE